MKRVRLSFKPFSILAGCALLLSACGGSASVAPASSAAASAPTTASASPASASASAAAPSSAKPAASQSASASAASAASSSASSSGTANAAAKGPIKIGVIGPMTGPDSINGLEHRKGVDLYLASINSTIAGRKIEPQYVDGQAQAAVALPKAKELVENEHVQMLMGISTTPVCYSLAQYVKTAHVPLAVTINCGAQYLTVDPKFASPYLVRFTQTGSSVIDPAADWAYNAGHKKAILITDDYGGGIETGDLFASAFIKRGGSIIQEIHPAVGTTDFGPFLTQLNPDADIVVAFLIGSDSLKFTQQYGTYAGKKTPILDLYGQITNGPNVQQLKDTAVGIVSSYVYSEAADNPENKAFLNAFHAKYPGQLVSGQVAQGYGNMQAIAAAIKAVNGDVENTQQFLNALYNVNVQTIKGPIKLDKFHNVVQNDYIFQVTKNGSSFGQKMLKTYTDVGQFWDRTQQQLDRLKAGTHKGQWVGMTKDKLAAIEGA